MFSTPSIRLIVATLYSPEYAEHCTLFVDGQDSRIIFFTNQNDGRSDEQRKRERYSWKEESSGVRMQIVTDPLGWLVTQKEANNVKTTDPELFIKLPLCKIMSSSDCMWIYGAYIFKFEEMVDLLQKHLVDVNLENFSASIRKQQNVELSKSACLIR